MKAVIAILFFLVLSPQILTADIEKVTIRWNAGICTKSCVEDLKKYLGRVRGITELSVTTTSASFKWEEGIPFSFSAVDAAMRYVGVRMRDMFITVSGTLSHTDTSVSIRSSNDGTRFNLLSPIQFTPGEAAARENIESHTLTEATRARLLSAEEQKSTVTIQGPIFRPFSAPPLNLLIENIKVEKEPDPSQDQKN